MSDINKILVPIDFTEFSSKIVEYAETIAEKFGAEIEVLFVVESLESYAGFAVPHISLDVMEKDLIDRAEAKMEDFLEANISPNISRSGKVLNGIIAEQIINYAQTHSSDLIVMGTHACKGIERALYGSVTERVVKTAPCPVLSMNPC